MTNGPKTTADWANFYRNMWLAGNRMARAIEDAMDDDEEDKAGRVRSAVSEYREFGRRGGAWLEVMKDREMAGDQKT